MTHPTGKGYFIWHIENCAGGVPEAIAAQAVQAGISHLLLKITNGTAEYPFQKTLDVALACREAGLEVHAWTYTFGINSLMQDQSIAEAELAAKMFLRLQQAGQGFLGEPLLDSLSIDAETEYKRPRGAKAAVSYTTRLRGLLPYTTLGLTSFRFPSLHADFPWRPFLDIAEYHMNQVYWEAAHNPVGQLDRSVRELKAMKDLPFVPVGPAYTERGWMPTVAEVDDFDEAVRGRGCPGICWWSYEHAQKLGQFWNAIARHPWSRSVPQPVSGAEKLERLWLHHPELHGVV